MTIGLLRRLTCRILSTYAGERSHFWSVSIACALLSATAAASRLHLSLHPLSLPRPWPGRHVAIWHNGVSQVFE